MRVVALVDWNSQIHAARPGIGSEIELAKRTLDYVGRVIGRALSQTRLDTRFDVSLRLYHGWHKGFEATARRRAMTTVIAETDFVALSCKGNVSIRDNVQFGDQLNSASSTRFHTRLNCHLPNTLRNVSGPGGEVEEKMVDTAIASDIVDIAHREPSNWILVLGEDDDLVPPLLVAEPMVAAHNGNILLVRRRSGEPFLKLQDIWCAI